MDTLPERAARALLLTVGVTTVLVLPAAAPSGGAALVTLLHHQFLIALIAAGLIAAVFVRPIRLPAVVAGLLSKAGFVAIAFTASGSVAGPGGVTTLYADLAGMTALLLAGALLLRAARQEARWDALPAQRLEH